MSCACRRQNDVEEATIIQNPKTVQHHKHVRLRHAKEQIANQKLERTGARETVNHGFNAIGV